MCVLQKDPFFVGCSSLRHQYLPYFEMLALWTEMDKRHIIRMEVRANADRAFLAFFLRRF
jgi:hypothetical protein